MLDNFIVSKSSSLPLSLTLSRAAVNEGFNWFYGCKVEESFFLFLSFSFFFIPFFFTSPSVFVVLLFGFLLVFLFLIPPRIKFLWKFIPPLPLIRCSTRRACNFREAHISSARILAAVSHASHRTVSRNGFLFFPGGWGDVKSCSRWYSINVFFFFHKYLIPPNIEVSTYDGLIMVKYFVRFAIVFRWNIITRAYWNFVIVVVVVN